MVGIIEIKKSQIQHLTTWEATRQGYRYQQFRVPVRIVYGIDQALKLLKDAREGKLWQAAGQPENAPSTVASKSAD